MDYAEMTLEEVLRTYSSVKGHCTRCEREIQSLIALLKVQYSAPSETRINDRLEKHTHNLSDITDYLLTAKHTKAKDHKDEVTEFFAVLVDCATEIFTVIHNRHAAAPTAVHAAQAAPTAAWSAPKPSAELKPDKLSHETTMVSFQTWKKQFRAYYDAGSLLCTQQQAYLNCIDEFLRARADRESTATTPVYSPIQGLMTCIAILDNYFLEVNPIHPRRKQFFDARQKEGQTSIEFRDEFLSLMDEADGANIGVNDLICMISRLDHPTQPFSAN